MVTRSVASFVLVSLLGITALAQDAPTPPAENLSRAFAIALGGSGGYLGVQTAEVSRDNFSRYGLSGVRGVAVDKVVEGSPAESAGVQSGDVIVRFNGEEVTSTTKLTRLISEVAPDHTARVTVFRNGAERELSITLGERPTPRFESGGFTMPRTPEAPMVSPVPRVEVPLPPGTPGAPTVWRFGGGRQLGIGIMALTEQLAEHYRVEGGIMVTNVRDESAAHKAGLRAGDIIVSLDGTEVKSDIELIRALQSKAEGDVSVTFVRNGARQTVNVTPEKTEAPRGLLELFRQNGDSPARPALPAGVPNIWNELYFPGRIL